MTQEKKPVMVPCGFLISRETGEILDVERCEMNDRDFRRIAAAVWGLKIAEPQARAMTGEIRA